MNNKQFEPARWDNSASYGLWYIFFIALQFCQARQLLEGSAVHFDTLKYLRIHFIAFFSKPFKQLSRWSKYKSIACTQQVDNESDPFSLVSLS